MQQLLADSSNATGMKRTLLLVAAPAAAAAAGLWLFKTWRQSRQLPPGPVGLPLLGCVPFVPKGQLHLYCQSLSRKYGDIVSFRLGPQLVVLVDSYELIKEMLEGSEFAGKPQTKFLNRIIQGCGIVLAQGPSWQHHRRTTLRILRDFGFARTQSVEMVDRQLDAILELLDECCEEQRAIRLLDTLVEATNGVVAELTLKKRFSKGDPELQFVIRTARKIFSTPILLSASFLVPDFIMRRLPQLLSLERSITELNEFIKQQIHARRLVMADEDAEPECLADVYLREQKRANSEGDFETYKEMQIIRVCAEFFLAGTDTTARSLEWLLLYMSFHPEVQRRVAAELDSIVGEGRRPSTSDRQKLHYCLATIEEVYRIVSLAALGIVHAAMEDTWFRGHRIPSNALIMPFVFGVAHSERYWTQPEQFRPQRFLDAEGKFSGPGKNIPFLIGRRSCAGESLARLEVFLMFTAVMQRYSVAVSAEFASQKEQILAGSMGQFRLPGEHKLLFQRR